MISHSGDTFSAKVEASVEKIYSRQKADAQKRGRRAEWPYVPVVRHYEPGPQLAGYRNEQITGRAYTTREEAIAYAQLVIDHRATEFRKKLTDPRYRALREQCGLPSEIGASQ